MSSTQKVIELTEVSKQYRLYDRKIDRLTEVLIPFKGTRHRIFNALQKINLNVDQGEVLGIVGRNGSGKSTLLKVISGIMPPSSGELNVSGKVVPLIELGAGFNPEFTGLENIFFYNSLHGFSRTQTEAILDEILDFAEIGDFIHQPLKVYSSGMMARLAFAVSINISPDILILDEVLSVGDEMFRRKCFAKMEAFFKGDKTVLFVSHSADSINELCTRCVWLHEGELILNGPPKVVTAMYRRLNTTKQEQMPMLLEEIRALNENEELMSAIYDEISILKESSNKIINGISNISVISEDGPVLEKLGLVKTKGQFIPDLIPKSMVFDRHPHIDLYDIRIEEITGEKVNVILSGEQYLCRYRVTFKQTFPDVYFRILITNETGLILAAMNTRKTDATLSQVHKDDEYTIDWQFRCNLLSGYYFLSVSVLSIEQESVTTLTRVSDALVFQVIETNEIKQGGYVSLDLKSTITKN
jgi:lipopolysaccharide transport system ATP-binding protein